MEPKNLWAPWRIEYIKAIGTGQGCFICDYHKTSEQDEENLVLWRSRHCLVMLNKFPYNNGHLLIAPHRHIADLDEASCDELGELIKLVRESQHVLTAAIGPHGFNVGVNFGRCAGAGLPGHLHFHVVPRWDGDTNFMSVCGNTDVISQSLRDLYDELKEISGEKNLPKL